MIAINLETYGDFDIPVNNGILIPPEGMGKSSVIAINNEIEKKCANDRNPDRAIKLFKEVGFTVLFTLDCTVGGNL